MLINSTIRSIYLEYYGGKMDMLDRADQYSEAKRVLDNDEWDNAITTIIRLYANACYSIIKLAACDIITLTNGDQDVVIDCDKIITDKDASLCIIDALQVQARYSGAEDKVAAIMADMAEEYKANKDIDSLVAKFLDGSWHKADIANAADKASREYLVSISGTKLANISEVYDVVGKYFEIK